MILFKSGRELALQLQMSRRAGRQIGFVPTMGALHAGHLSLIERSQAEGAFTVCSIFVNPTQFNDPKDFRKYPITLEKDMYLLEKAGVEALFLPEVEEMYPGGIQGLEHYDLGKLETVLEGKYRPGHFQGVCQAVSRLLDKVRPDDLFMGQKDYQQCMVVRRLIGLIGSDTLLHVEPIVREPDGLAMSSRNMRLTEAERKKATVIYRALSGIRAGWQQGEESSFLMATARDMLIEEGLKPDYVEIAGANDLAAWKDQQADNRSGEGTVIALAAAFLGEIRLIDNMFL